MWQAALVVQSRARVVLRRRKMANETLAAEVFEAAAASSALVSGLPRALVSGAHPPPLLVIACSSPPWVVGVDARARAACRSHPPRLRV